MNGWLLVTARRCFDLSGTARAPGSSDCSVVPAAGASGTSFQMTSHEPPSSFRSTTQMVARRARNLSGLRRRLDTIRTNYSASPRDNDGRDQQHSQGLMNTVTTRVNGLRTVAWMRSG